MKYQVGDIVEFSYGSKPFYATRTIVLLNKLKKGLWRAELMNDTNDYYENDGIFHISETDVNIKLVWRQK